jgi:cytochrome c-type biogenesis protein CcmF
MIFEIGHFALVLALMVAAAQAVIPMAGAAKNNARWMAFAEPASYVQVALVVISFAALTYAFVVSDFSVKLVVESSNSTKPMLFKITGVWASHEGSMLFWVMILSLYGAAMAVFGGNLPPGLKARAISVQAMVAVGFYLYILLTSNPFLRFMPPAIDGRGMNPLLQDIGLAFHPPFLYLGYVGFSVAFSFSIAALIEGRVDAAWARWVRPWTIAAWAFLTFGIALGSWWAYYELGWGGFWFWDPVENSSFIPWLVGTALLHSAIVVEKRDTMRAWTVFLAIITFALSILGTFLVRSGVLTSVHAFVSSPARGAFILVLLTIVAGGSLALYAWRGPQLKSQVLFQPISREGALLLDNILMTTGAAVVLLGTLYPLFIDILNKFTGGTDKISVGAPFFNATFIPLMVPTIIAMAIGPMMSWKRSDLGPAITRLAAAFVAALVAAAAAWSISSGDSSILGSIGMGLAAWLGIGTLTELGGRIKLFKAPVTESLRRFRRIPRASWGMTLGHFGMAVAIAGIAGAGSWKTESIQVMRPGDVVNVAGFNFTFKGARQGRGPNYQATIGTFDVSKNGNKIVSLYPEKRNYPASGTPTTEAAIHTLVTGDLYAVIGNKQKNGGYVTRLYFNPMVVWMWVGALIMVFGGVISVTDRRYRVGAPKERKRRAAPQPQAAE